MRIDKGHLSLLYDTLYNEADKVFKEYNPCEINSDGICKHNRKCCNGKKTGVICKYLGDNGCTIRCLSCKLWTCKTLNKSNPEIREMLEPLNKIAKLNELVKFRTTKEMIIWNGQQ